MFNAFNHSDDFHNLEQFYEHQKATWEKLRKAYDPFGLNALELEKDPQARPALKRMNEILTAANPYPLIKEAEGLIATVGKVNAARVGTYRQQAIQKIDGHVATLTKDTEAAQADPAFLASCLKPLEALKARVQAEESLAHITQAEAEALKELDAANARIEEFVRRAPEPTEGAESGKTTVKVKLKKKRVVEPKKLVQSSYLETKADVDGFLDTLRKELEQAIENDERVEIR